MKKTILGLLIVLLLLSFSANAQEGGPFQAVQKLFASMSAYNYEAMYGTATNDFQLLENGEIWDMAKLEEAVKTDEGILERRNFFSVIKTAQNGESIWISYWGIRKIHAEIIGVLIKEGIRTKY